MSSVAKLFFAFCFYVSPIAAVAATVDAKRAELKDIQSRIGTLQKELSKSEASKADAAEELRDIESSISTANRKLRELSDNRTSVQVQLKDLEQQSHQLSGLIERQQSQISNLLYQQFVQGGGDALHELLAGGDPNQSARDRYLLTLLSRQKANVLGEMHDTLNEKKQLAETARAKNDELAAIEAQQGQQRAALLTQQKQRQSLLLQIASRIKSQQKQIETLKGNEKRLGKLIDGLAKLAIARSSGPKSHKPGKRGARMNPGQAARGLNLSNVSGEFAALRGKLRLPVHGEIADRFGSPRGDRATTWKGLFIRAAEGSDVRAVANGTVVYADWLRGFGNLVIIDHGDGFLSVYGNNQSLLREAGVDVKSGEAIAAVGASGGIEESGLYFELRHQSQPFDPLRWINLK